MTRYTSVIMRKMNETNLYTLPACKNAKPPTSIESPSPNGIQTLNWSSDELVTYIRKKYKTDFLNLTELQLNDLFRYLKTVPIRLGEKKLVSGEQLGFSL